MRSACAIGFGLAFLFAGGLARAQEDTTKAKPTPSVTIIVIETQPGVVVGPVGQAVTPGGLIRRMVLPAAKTPAAPTPATKPRAACATKAHAGRFQRMDTNKDGKISLAEFKGPKDVFASVDADHDGFITRPEATRAYLAFVGLLSLQEKARAYRAMDVNKDGKLSQAEFKGSKALFARLDANHDGSITPAEARRAFRGYVGRAMVVARLKSMDANHDGLISAVEFKGPKPAFARLDANHDGNISRVELAKVFQAAPKAVATAAKPKAPAPVVPAKTISKTKAPVALAPWAKHILALDTNKDGKICKAEFLKGLEVRFARLDQDKDGYITTADITKVVQARKAAAARTPVTKPAAVGKAKKAVIVKPEATAIKTAKILKKP